MKKNIILFTALSFLTLLSAQSPGKISYQAVIRNSGNELVVNSTIGMRISLLKGSSTGVSVYTETQTTATNGNGLISIEIGSGATTDDFSTIDWANGPYFIQVEIDISGGDNYTISGTSQLLSVPYALYAKSAGTVSENDPLFKASIAAGITAADTTRWGTKDSSPESDPVFSASVAKGISAADTTRWGSGVNDYNALVNKPSSLSEIGMDGGAQTLTNLADPTNPQDAATKAYIDNLLIQIIETAKLFSAGYNENQLYNGGHSIEDILLAGGDGGELYKAGAPVSDLLAEGITVKQLWNAGATAKELSDAGASVTDMINAGVAVIDLFNLGHGVGKLEYYGANSDSLIAAGLVGTMTDIEGNTYKWVKIGNQVWMAENLRTTKYNDNSSIPWVTSSGWLSTTTTPMYCWYANDSATHAATYGALYNWYAASQPNVCPTGWHVSTDAEWIALTDHLGGLSSAAGQLKKTGTTYWDSPNTGASNYSGFNAIGSGRINPPSDYLKRGAYYWTSSEPSPGDYDGWRYNLIHNKTSVSRVDNHKYYGGSIRCVKD
ncbi:MAG: hypothetical protein MI922_25890 [Bacteroidales bacterium]|nr:hypothetical protein [Bacteroidales bacterium]